VTLRLPSEGAELLRERFQREIEDLMGVLWFVHAEAMYGFPAYDFPVSEIIRNFGGEASFKFLCRLDQPPNRARAHDRDHVANYDRLNWMVAKARSVRWRSGFYEVQQSRKDVFDMLWATQTFLRNRRINIVCRPFGFAFHRSDESARSAASGHLLVER